MLKNLNTAKLLVILVILVSVYVAFNFFGNNTRSKSFHEELVTIDTSQVDKIVLAKGEEVLELKKENEDWFVKIENGNFAKAKPQSVRNTLDNLLSIKPSRIVARSKDKWKDYQVDSAGTNVQVFEKGNKSLDLMIGRFGFKDQRNYHTYMRLANEEDTYVANNFMAMSLNTGVNNYRNSTLARIKKDSVSSVRFNYPDSSFTLTRDDTVWTIDGLATDSTSTDDFFSGLNYLNSTTFYDEELPIDEPQLSVVFERKSEDDIVVKCWKANDSTRIIQSSENEDNNFTDENVFEKIFKSYSDFFGSE